MFTSQKSKKGPPRGGPRRSFDFSSRCSLILMVFLKCCCGSGLELVFFHHKGTWIWGSFWEPLWGSILSPFWAPKRYHNEPVGVDLGHLFSVGGRFGAKTPPDVSGQISHRTFEGNGPTGCFSKYLPKTPEISGNFPGTWSNDLIASSARQPM